MHPNHFVIPDTQIRPGIPLDFLDWVGEYMVDRYKAAQRAGVDFKIIMLGDWYDLPSMSAWDKNKTSERFQGRQYKADVQAGHDALDRMEKPLRELQEQQRRNKERIWRPEKHYLLGNHEHRVDRYVETAGEVEGIIGTFQFREHWEDRDWITHGFQEIVMLDGVGYSHYFYNPLTGNPWGGMIETRLKNIGYSFTQGHTQTLLAGCRYVRDQQQWGIVAGSCYLHDEDYKGPQGNCHWRGVIVKHAVNGGSYNPMFVDLDWLCMKYEKKPLDKFMRKIWAVAA